jgi:hypothetical protein
MPLRDTHPCHLCGRQCRRACAQHPIRPPRRRQLAIMRTVWQAPLGVVEVYMWVISVGLYLVVLLQGVGSSRRRDGDGPPRISYIEDKEAGWWENAGRQAMAYELVLIIIGSVYPIRTWLFARHHGFIKHHIQSWQIAMCYCGSSWYFRLSASQSTLPSGFLSVVGVIACKMAPGRASH